MIRRYIGKLKSDRAYSWLLVASIELACILLDYWTGPLITLLPLYLANIALAAWLLSRWWVIAIVTIAVVARAWIFQQQDVPVAFLLSLIDAISNVLVFVFVVYLVEMLKQTLKELAEIAGTDHLTQVKNRKSFYELGAAEIARSYRHQIPFTIAFIDLDNFKQVNDNVGHAMGDQVLATVASTIKLNLRDGDILGRLGGDEFVVLLHHTNSQQAQMFVERVRGHLHQAVSPLDSKVDFSMGAVTNASCNPLTLDELLKVADKAMYEIKHSGKGAIRYVVL